MRWIDQINVILFQVHCRTRVKRLAQSLAPEIHRLLAIADTDSQATDQLNKIFDTLHWAIPAPSADDFIAWVGNTPELSEIFQRVASDQWYNDYMTGT
jgi:hypothetical protein